jgi:glycerol-3-phosphate dehydrogenase
MVMYDVAIIGCGIVGCACAYELSKYNLKIVAVEKNNDICCGTTKANSAIIHAGYDPKPNTLMAKLNVRGSLLTKEICKNLDIAYNQIGSLVVAFSDDEVKNVETLFKRGVENGVPDLKIIDKSELKELEPYISDEAICALYAPTAGIIDPWEFGIAMAETAVKNGTEIMLDSQVQDIIENENYYSIKTKKGTIEAKYVINCAGVNSDDVHNMTAKKDFTIIGCAGEYYLLDKSECKRASHVIFQCPNKDGKGVLVSPTIHGNLIVGPNAEVRDKNDTSTKTLSLDFVKEKAVKSVPSISFKENIRNFTGVRALSEYDDFIIKFAKDRFLDVAGIKSPGLSSSPAIAEYVVELLSNSGLEFDKKSNFINTRKHIRFNKLTPDEKNKLISENSAYGRIICRCETVTEGEILDALSSAIPPVSLDGIKRRVGAGMGRCQGGFCGPRVLEIIAKYYNVPYENILQDNTGSYILTEPTKNGGKADV